MNAINVREALKQREGIDPRIDSSLPLLLHEIDTRLIDLQSFLNSTFAEDDNRRYLLGLFLRGLLRQLEAIELLIKAEE